MNMPEVDPSAGFHTRIQAIESAAIREMITRYLDDVAQCIDCSHV